RQTVAAKHRRNSWRERRVRGSGLYYGPASVSATRPITSFVHRKRACEADELLRDELRMCDEGEMPAAGQQFAAAERKPACEPFPALGRYQEVAIAGEDAGGHAHPTEAT